MTKLQIIFTIIGFFITIIYGLPSMLNYYRDNFSKLKVRCISGIKMTVERDLDSMGVIQVFDITISNTTSKKLFLSEIKFEMKNRFTTHSISLNPFFIENKFENILESGESIQKIIICKDSQHQNPIVAEYREFNKFRIKIESSIGKVYKSKWYKSSILFNIKTVKWELGKGSHLDYIFI